MAKMKILSRVIRGLSILGNNEIKTRSIAASMTKVCAGLQRESIIYICRETIFINKMFSAILEKVERLERENAELKSRLDQLDKDTADRLGHHVCVGIGIHGKPMFKRPPSLDNETHASLTFNLTNELSVFFVDSLKFFPIFKEFGIELSLMIGFHEIVIDDEWIRCPWEVQDNNLIRGIKFDLFRETCLKYGVQLLFNGKPIDEEKDWFTPLYIHTCRFCNDTTKIIDDGKEKKAETYDKLCELAYDSNANLHGIKLLFGNYD